MSDIYEVNGVVVDAETGEIIESDGDPLERIIAAGLEAKEQIRIWENYHNAMRAAAGGMLDDDRKRVDTVSGTAKRVVSTRKRALPTLIPRLQEDYELTESQVNLLFSCAKELDADALMRFPAEVIPSGVVDALITVTHPSWVQFDPIRKAAPKPIAVEA